MRYRIIGICVALLFCATLSAQVMTLKPNFKKNAPYNLSIYPTSDTIVKDGYFAYHVEISNRSDKSASFDVTAKYEANYSSGQHNTHSNRTDTFTVPPGETRRFISQVLSSDISDNTWGAPAIEFWVSGPGIQGRHAGEVSTTYSGYATESVYIGFIGKLHGQVGASLANSSNEENKIGRFTPNYLPNSHHGFMGWDMLAINIDEWSRLNPEARSAILDWVTFGGQLVFSTYDQSTVEQAFLEQQYGLIENGQSHELGLGRIIRLDSQGTKTWNQWITGNITGTKERRFYAGGTQWLGDQWNQLIQEEPVSMNALFVSLFMVAFAVVVGPINLIKFAPAHRRFRIFITTPIISLVASLTLIVVILLGDGVGGYSHRSTLSYLDQEDGKYYVDERAIVRSSLLFDTKVRTDREMGLIPMMTHTMDSQAMRNLDQDDRNISSGDFLKNRSWQALGASFTEPTRSEVSVSQNGDGGYEVYSSISAQLDKGLFLASDGSTWIVDSLGQGGRKSMQAANPKSVAKMWQLIEKNVNRAHYTRLRRLAAQKDIFIGITDAIQELPTMELPSIKTRGQFTVVCSTTNLHSQEK